MKKQKQKWILFCFWHQKIALKEQELEQQDWKCYGVIKNQAAQLHFIHLKIFTSHFMTFKIMHKNWENEKR